MRERYSFIANLHTAPRVNYTMCTPSIEIMYIVHWNFGEADIQYHVVRTTDSQHIPKGQQTNLVQCTRADRDLDYRTSKISINFRHSFVLLTFAYSSIETSSL